MQVWNCVQDKKGVLYFGNSTNILEYDGKSWRKIFITSGVAIRSLIKDKKGTIYVGAVGEFGYLKPNEKGEMTYQSISKNLNQEAKKFADIWEIHELNDAIIFQSSENLFVYENGIVKTIPPSSNSFASISFKVGNKIYFRERKIGMLQFDGKKTTLISGGEVFANEPIVGMVNYPKENKNQIIALSVDQGFFLMNLAENEIKKINPSSQKEILDAGPLGIKWLNDSSIILNTRSGLFFLNKNLEIITRITKNDGLNDESIANIFFDSEDQLWVCTNNGISKISIHSPLYYYSNKTGFSGNIESIIIFNDKIYLGTTSGMSSAILNDNNISGKPKPLQFEQIGGTYFEVWNFNTNGNQLFAATSDGVFEIVGNNSKRLTKAYSTVLCNSTTNSNRMYVGEKDGLKILEKDKNNEWKIIKYIEIPTSDILYLIETKNNLTLDLWAATRNNGILKITLDTKLNYKISQYDSTQGAPKQTMNIINNNNKLYFFTTTSTYEYLPNLDNGKQKCFTITKDLDLAYNHSGNKLDLLNKKSAEGKITQKALLFLENQGYTFYQNSDKILWIGLTDVLVRYDAGIKKDYTPSYNTIIRKVTIGKDSLLNIIENDSTKKNIEQTINYNYNSISFDYAAAFFEREDKLLYSYKLSGFDTAWSDWSSTGVKQYTNLYEGEYTFSVKAKNIYKHESTIANYKFTILPPLYRTIWAYVFYFLGLIIIIILIVQLSVRRLQIAKIKLERIVSERTSEVVKQKEELIEKNTIIEVAYNDIKSSINYAKRIQEAILPLKEEIKKTFPESFVLFKPRDIVSGDFYWFTKHNNHSIIACVDCTGHGVPGAFMSMIGNTLLNEIVIEKNIVTPAEILTLLHERVRQSLKQDLEQSETRDGMDISICVFNNNKTQLQYAGANRSLIFIKENKLQEIKADKQPIGGDQMNEDRVFTNHTLELKKGDVIYMTTDGYADQFGGEKGKKFMVKRFHQTLIALQKKVEMEKQGELLEKKISEWQGNLEQVDDILVIGIKI